MRRCKRCLLPETHETICFDSEGICNICAQAEVKTTIDWKERRIWLDSLARKYKGRGSYDCIVPYSGGKDSVFQLFFVVEELGLKPLVVRFNHLGFRPLVDENNRQVFSCLGVDFVEYAPSPKLVRRLMRESLAINGDFCWHCHMGIFSTALRAAITYETPLVVFGESPAEYTAYCNFEELLTLDEKLFETVVSLGATIDEMIEAVSDEFEAREFFLFRFPPERDLAQANVTAIWLGNYIQWDTRANVELIQRELGWRGQEVEGVPPCYPYEKIECRWQGVRDWCKYIKRGYGRASHLSAIDLRNGRITLDQALQQIEEYDGVIPSSLPRFLEEVGLSEGEFYKTMQSFIDPRWSFEHSQSKRGKELDDMANWGLLC